MQSLGIVLNLSDRFDKLGRRLIDIIRKKVSELIYTFEDEDIIYIYQRNELNPCKNKGSACSLLAILNPIDIDLEFALIQTMYIIANADPYSNKSVLYITDKFSPNDNSILEKCKNTSEIEMLDVNFVFKSVSNQIEDKSKFEHIDDPNLLDLKDFHVR